MYEKMWVPLFLGFPSKSFLWVEKCELERLVLSRELILNCTFTIHHPIDLVVVPYKLDFKKQKCRRAFALRQKSAHILFLRNPRLTSKYLQLRVERGGFEKRDSCFAFSIDDVRMMPTKNRVGKGNQFRDRGYQKTVYSGEATFVSIALVGRWRRVRLIWKSQKVRFEKLFLPVPLGRWEGGRSVFRVTASL